MEKVELPIHKHPLLPISRFSYEECKGCGVSDYIYGGYRCNELGCKSVFHRKCAEPLPEINHSLHPYHPLKLLIPGYRRPYDTCNRCRMNFENWYICSICDFRLDFRCAKKHALILENFDLHQHPLKLFDLRKRRDCNTCSSLISKTDICYRCSPCDLLFHGECAEFFPEANHTSHPQHPLKLLSFAALPDYAEKKCLLCGIKFDNKNNKLHHCDVCNFSICRPCMKCPPPVRVESPTTHEHELHLVPRRIDFTCNTCGTLGDRSPYFCLQCNFMIHRDCIDLPRVININRHDHRISYTRRLGDGEEWKCKVCRKKVDGFYGVYTCKKCPRFVVHSLCATRGIGWDGIELEGMSEEEEEIAPFEVIDDITIKHFSHDHNLLRINNDGHGHIQPENIVCEACRLQILSEPFYACKQCTFFLHEICANHPRKKRHVRSDLPFTLLTDSPHEVIQCHMCSQPFTGFRYKTIDNTVIDVRCAAISDTIEHGSHPHPLYYHYSSTLKFCSRCGNGDHHFFSCDECDYKLDGCALIPGKVMRNRYDDHPLVLCFGEKIVDSDYWCEACETKVDPKEWFYTCNGCGTTLHISCVVGDFSCIMPGSHLPYSTEEVVVSNTSIYRPLCPGACSSRCKLPSVLKFSKDGEDVYVCSFRCIILVKRIKSLYR